MSPSLPKIFSHFWNCTSIETIKMKIFLGTLVCLIISASSIAASPTTTSASPTTPGCPSDGNSVQPFPGDCTKFIACVDGIQSVEVCPDGYLFNDDIGACDFPENVPECAAAPTTQTPVICDEGSADGFMPYPGDCTKYIKCDGIRGSVMDCPAGLYWNQAESQCDFPENTECSIVCDKGSADGFMPYTGDCTKYIKCDGINGTVMDCPAGLYWNQAESQCDFPENTDCDDSTTKAPPTTLPTTEVPTTEPASTENPTTEQPTTEVPTTENPTTPPTTPSTITCTDGANFMPYPGDCTKYIKCDGTNGSVMQCPDGLNWNQDEELCDFPENTKCDIPTTENPSTAITTPEPTTTEV